MIRVKKWCAILLTITCVVGLCACGKQGSNSGSSGAETGLYYDTISKEISSRDGAVMDLLHGCFTDIYTSSATTNAFMTKVSDAGAVEYALNNKELSYDQYYRVETAMKSLEAKELNEFELLSFAIYLNSDGSAYQTDISKTSQKKLFEFMQGVYAETDTEVNFRNALSEARKLYYETLNVDSVSHISYDINGDYLHIGDNALMSGLFGFGNGETVVGCYETRQSMCPITYKSEDGGEASMDAYSHVGIIFGSKGTAIGYEYITIGSEKEAILRDIYYLVGGGCVNGVISEEEYPTNLIPADTLFFQERSLGSFAQMECTLVFNKLVKDFNVTSMSTAYAIEQDIGVTLIASNEVYTGGLLQSIGYLPDDAEVLRSAVGRVPYGEDDTYGDLYGWYELSVPDARDQVNFVVEGFAVLHNRDYGFSAENYIRIF